MPLLFVFIATAFALTPVQYRPAVLSRSLPGYPVRIDLTQVKEVTRQADFARRQVQTGTITPEGDDIAEAQTDNSPITPVTVAEDEVSAARSGTDRAPAAMASDRLTRRNSDEAGVLAIDYDLSGGPQSASTLQLRKDVQRNGQVLGRLEIRIDNNADIFVDRDELLRILPSAPPEAARLADDFVKLTDLRATGINLRYDPVGDKLVLRE